MRDKMITVKVTKPDVGAIAKAAFSRDVDGLTDILDATFTFGGPLGSLVERIDGPVTKAVAEWLIEYGPEFAEELQALRKD
jgi:hypothetical protein